MDGYGSLDRSWARNRTRGSGGYKKRPDLMSADFSGAGNTLAPSPLAVASHPDSSGTTLEPLDEVVNDSRKSPRREWKSPIENTDVVGAIEAIESKQRDSFFKRLFYL